ncbi:hypothetical protein NEDG_00586 [Nematocida displodere]|uniref:Uncharacterized protein n=1 Tax=Nematocida displodere TaxID=1805483 RepID=A0A177EBX0_9MICR|nr:hypothetical protein NEDG_00586 [Nematocida displodere]
MGLKLFHWLLLKEEASFRMQALALLALCVLAASATLDVGFFLIPKNNLDSPKALSLSGGTLHFEAIDDKSKETQVFIQLSLGGSKVCLKYNTSLCIALDKKMYHKEISVFKKHVQCAHSLRQSKLNVQTTPYSRIVMLQLSGCKKVCLYSHAPEEQSGGERFLAMLDQCRPGNINNMFYAISEDEIDDYLSEKETDQEIDQIETNPQYIEEKVPMMMGAPPLNRMSAMGGAYKYRL